jgi:hypothetical protein
MTDFTFLVRLTGGGAREHLGLLQETLLHRLVPSLDLLEERLLKPETSLCSVSTNELYSLINGGWQLRRPSRRRSKLQKKNQSLPKSLFFLIVSLNQSHGFEKCWKTFTQKGQRLGFQNFWTSR